MIAESVLTRRKQLLGYERRDTAASLAMGIGNVLIDLLWKGTALAGFELLRRHALFEIGTGVAAWVLLLFVEDFLYYWNHRFHHESRFLWAAHVNHHSSQHYNLSTALRQSWTTPFTFLLFYWPLPLLGFDPAMALAAHSVNRLYQFWIHTEAIRTLGPLEWVFNTPSHHRVHHGKNVRYLDANYGGILIVWDRLFGSFVQETEPVRYGLTKDIDTFNPLKIAFHEWAAIARDMARPNPLRLRLGYFFRAPGWSPDGSTLTAKQMKAALEPLRSAPPVAGGGGMARTEADGVEMRAGTSVVRHARTGLEVPC